MISLTLARFAASRRQNGRAEEVALMLCGGKRIRVRSNSLKFAHPTRSQKCPPSEVGTLLKRVRLSYLPIAALVSIRIGFDCAKAVRSSADIFRPAKA